MVAVNRTARIVLAITLSISAVAVVVAALLARTTETPKLGLWLGLLLAGAAMELATIPGDDEEAEHPFSLASSFHMAAAILLPAGWAALVAGGSTASARPSVAAHPSGRSSTPASPSPPPSSAASPTTARCPPATSARSGGACTPPSS